MKREEAPVFVKVDDYKDILDILGLVKNKLDEARKTLSDINDIKKEEDSEIEMWNSTVEEIEKKLEDIQTTLLEPERVW